MNNLKAALISGLLVAAFLAPKFNDDIATVRMAPAAVPLLPTTTTVGLTDEYLATTTSTTMPAPVVRAEPGENFLKVDGDGCR